MLWSMLKVLLFVAIVGLLTFGAGMLMDTGGAVRVAVGATEFSLSPLAATIGALVLLGVVWAVFRLVGLLVACIRFLNGDETAISRYFLRNRERRGFEALADGLMAIASGEGRLALQKASKAERYLNRPELTNLIAAQAAELAGDTTKAEEVYKRLLQDERTRFVGVRGILKQKLAVGDTATALKLAEKAFALKPKHEETQDTLLRLQAEHDDWTGARATLAAKLKSGALPRDVHKRRDAVLTYAEARDALIDGESEKAEALAVEANRLSPELIPAAALAADLLAKAGKAPKATTAIKKAWDAAPHPDLARAFAGIKPGESPSARRKRFDTLKIMQPDHPETRLLMAELALADEDFPGARKALGDLYESQPTARTLTIMAAIERGEGATDDTVREWLAKALMASRGPQWTCETCHNIHAEWVPICANCGAFDTLSWIEPPKTDLSIPNQAQMLPLIVGARPSPKSEDAPAPVPPQLEEAPPAAPESVAQKERIASKSTVVPPVVIDAVEVDSFDPVPSDGKADQDGAATAKTS